MYTVGEKVVHPLHGAGVIAEITEERVKGLTAVAAIELKMS